MNKVKEISETINSTASAVVVLGSVVFLTYAAIAIAVNTVKEKKNKK